VGSDEVDLFAEGTDDLECKIDCLSSYADATRVSKDSCDGLPFIGTSSYDDHSWDSKPGDSEISLPLHDADLALTAEVFDVDDVIQSIASLKKYRERVLESSTLYKVNITF